MTPIIKGVEGCTDDVPLVLPEELSWARGDPAISTAVFFLSSEAELMAKTFVPKVLILYMKSWISTWDGGKEPLGPRKHWLTPAVRQTCINNINQCRLKTISKGAEFNHKCAAHHRRVDVP